MPEYTFPSRCLLFYSLQLPNHRGKWRIVDWIRKSLNIRLTGEFEVERQNLKWLLDPNDFPHYELFWYGLYDEWQIFHLLRLLRGDSVILDIGSNLGYYSVTLGTKLPHSTIHAFEPNPPTHERLKKHIQLNGLKNVTAHRTALSDQPGSASLTQKAGNSGRTELVPGSDITVSTLDQFCAEQQIRKIDLLKIDVEGFEQRVLKGGMETIRRLKPHMNLEAHPVPLLRHGSSMAELMATLDDLGYVPFEAVHKRLVKVEKTPENDDVVTWFCFHRDRLSEVRL